MTPRSMLSTPLTLSPAPPPRTRSPRAALALRATLAALVLAALLPSACSRQEKADKAPSSERSVLGDSKSAAPAPDSQSKLQPAAPVEAAVTGATRAEPILPSNPPPPAPAPAPAHDVPVGRPAHDGALFALYSFISPPQTPPAASSVNSQASFNNLRDETRASTNERNQEPAFNQQDLSRTTTLPQDERARAMRQAAGVVALLPQTLPAIPGMLPGPNEELWIIERASQPRLDPAQRDPGSLGAGALHPNARFGSSPAPITATSINVDARIDGFIAQVTYRQSFKVDPSAPLDAVYLINLPPDAAVTDFQLAFGSRKIRAVICDRAEAARLFDAATLAGHRAVITSQVEGNRFAARISLPPPAARASDISIDMTYFHVLPMERDEFTLRVPLRVNAQPSGPQSPVQLAVAVRLNAAVPIEDLRSSSHAIRVDRATADNPLSRARAAIYLAGPLTEGESPAARDFVLHYRLAGDEPRPGMLTYTDAQGDTYFASFLIPPRARAITARHPIEWVLVIDRSSAVSPEQLNLTSQITSEFLTRIDARDRLRVEFSDGESIPSAADARASDDPLPPALPALRARITQALASLTPQGADTITPALRRALSIRGSPQLQRITLLISPARFSDAHDALAEIESTLKFNRVCTVSVGPTSDTAILLAIARYARGSFLHIDQAHDIEAVIRPFVSAHSVATLIDVSLDFNDTKGQDVLPRRAPDLLVDRPTMLLGRWLGKPASVVSVTARAGPDVKFMLLNPGVTDLREGNPALAQVWARLKLSDMATYANSATLPTFQTEARALSQQFGIPSPWTALLMVDATTPATPVPAAPAP